jgi:hypothetical protein
VLQVVTNDAASAIRENSSKFRSFRYLSSSGFYPLEISSLGDPVGSNVAIGLALRVTGTHMPLHPDNVEVPSEKSYNLYCIKYYDLMG